MQTVILVLQYHNSKYKYKTDYVSISQKYITKYGDQFVYASHIRLFGRIMHVLMTFNLYV